MRSYFRFLSRNKGYTAIEVVGLSIALAFVVLIVAFVAGELGYDKQLKGTDQVYVAHGETFSIMSYTVGDLLVEEFPEVEDVCRMVSTNILSGSTMEVTLREQTLPQEALVVDTNFFRFFRFPFVEGTSEESLQAPDAVVVSESFARRYFQEESPIGQRVEVTVGSLKKDLVISGVYETISRSVFPSMDLIYGVHHLAELSPNLIREGNGTAVNFFRLVPGTSVEALQEKALAHLKKNDILYRVGMEKEFLLSPFSQIHYGICVMHLPFVGRVNLSFILLFAAAAVLLLVFALLNYISLSVAQIGFRAREMATRRLLGEPKWKIMYRYIREAFLMTSCSFVLSLLLVKVFGPSAAVLLGKEVSLVDNLGVGGILVMVLLVAAVALLAGWVPAMLISRYKPIDVVKGTFAAPGKMRLGKAFICIQNVVTIATLCIALAMFVQFRYLLARDTGYERTGILAVEGAQRDADYLEDELLQLPFVEQVGWVQYSPAHSSRCGMGVSYQGEKLQLELMYGDSAAFRMLGFRVRSIHTQQLEGQDGSLWLTEGAMTGMGLDYSADHVVLSGVSYPICGIIQDIQKGGRSLEDCASSNLVWWNKTHQPGDDLAYLRSLVVKVSGSEQEATAALQHFYDQRLSQHNMSISSLQSIYRGYFSEEENNLKLITLFTLLVMMLTAMALLAMSTYYTRQQARNWSIRKVFGCSRKEVFWSMSWGFLKVVAVAALIAVPVGYLVVQQWLSGYVYRINNAWWIYGAAIVLIALVAILSVSYQTLQLMNTNPIRELKRD